jgi:hypothetical protein
MRGRHGGHVYCILQIYDKWDVKGAMVHGDDVIASPLLTSRILSIKSQSEL